MLVFVYGTLKAGFPNHALNPGRLRPGRFRTTLHLPLYVVGLPNEERAPWLVDAPGEGHQVLGEVYDIDLADLVALDAFEEVGLPLGYIRTPIDLEQVDVAMGSSSLRAQAYLKPTHHLASGLVIEGPYPEYTQALASGYRLEGSG